MQRTVLETCPTISRSYLYLRDSLRAYQSLTHTRGDILNHRVLKFCPHGSIEKSTGDIPALQLSHGIYIRGCSVSRPLVIRRSREKTVSWKLLGRSNHGDGQQTTLW